MAMNHMHLDHRVDNNPKSCTMNMSFKPHVLVQSPVSSEGSSEPLSHCIMSATSSDCHTRSHTRKRRRGVIEKRRRDRINDSLNELKRLIPAAREKAGSAKLEKAEILQMTVEYLRTLENVNTNSDPTSQHQGSQQQSPGRITGFQECTAEVAKYLVSVEGLDIHDPLRLRLVSHLQQVLTTNCYRSSVTATPASSVATPNLYCQPWYEANYEYYQNSGHPQHQHQQHLMNRQTGYVLPPPHALYSNMSYASGDSNPVSSSDVKPDVNNANEEGNSNSNNANSNSNSNNSKPYRPWGAGMVSC